MDSMRKYFVAIAMAIGVTASSWALQVASTAGNLKNLVSDCGITSLTVTGTIDARDFKFISDSLNKLTAVDLSGATIVAYDHSENPIFESISSYEAASIPGTSFFGKKSLASVVLPQGLRSIGFAAFAGCESLTTVSIPATVDSIASYAFSGTGLTQVELPATVTRLGEGVWARCTALTAATVPVASIGNYDFLGDINLSKVTLGSSVQAIGTGAFNGCTALKSLAMPDGSAIVKIGNEAFVLSGIENLDLSGLSGLQSVGDWALAGTPVGSIKLPDNVTALGRGAFFYDTQLASVNLPSGVTAVSDYTFAGDSAAAVGRILAEGNTRIGDYAFYNVSAPAYFFIPSSVSYLGTKAMAGMTGLDTIKALPTTVPELGDSVWAGLNQSAVNLDIPDSLVAADYAAAEQWKEFHILKDYLLGDVNVDGNIDVTDVTALISHMLGLEQTRFNPYAADIDGDGDYNVTDVTLLCNLVLDQDRTYVRRAGSTSRYAGNTTADNLYIDNFSIKPGQSRTVQVRLNNSQDYIGLQCEITMPQGLEIVSGTITNASATSNLMLPSRLLSDGATTRVMAYSMTNSVIKADDNAVMNLTVKAADDFGAEGVIDIDGLVLVDKNCTRYVGAGSTTLVSSATGVNDVNAAAVKVYAHDGVLVIESQEVGTAQLVAMNGTATSLLVEAGRNEYQGFAPGIYVVRIAGKSYKVAIR